jgi:hypothetical protein
VVRAVNLPNPQLGRSDPQQKRLAADLGPLLFVAIQAITGAEVQRLSVLLEAKGEFGGHEHPAHRIPGCLAVTGRRRTCTTSGISRAGRGWGPSGCIEEGPHQSGKSAPNERDDEELNEIEKQTHDVKPRNVPGPCRKWPGRPPSPDRLRRSPSSWRARAVVWLFSC